jgi:gliding motility-associated-like protein
MHVCQKDGGEAVQQQVFPAQAWGTRYLTHHTLSSFTGNINETFRNYYRVCVKEPNTVVKRNGVVLTGLIRNFFYQFMDSTGGDYIEADKPILVSQYTPNRAQCWMNIQPAQTAIGDPEMFYLSPIEQGQKSVIFYTSSLNLISKSYVNIIIPTTGISSMLLDGAAVPAAKIKIHPNNPAYSVAIADLSGSMDMQHKITSDSAFTATVYGLGAYESYGYNIGCNINNLDTKNEIKNVFGISTAPDTVTCPNTPFRIYAKIGYRLTNIQWKFSLVPGLTPNADSIIANPIPVDSPLINGRKYYTYSVQQNLSFANAGTYKIPYSYTSPNVDACNNTENDTVVVVVQQGPQANFSFTNPVCQKDTMYLNGTSNNNGFTIYDYLWNFDDATSQNTVNAKKKFNTPGSHNVRYRIFATSGCVGDTTKAVNIYDSPVSKLGVSSPICQKDSALISDTSSISIGTIASWRYDFGDGNTLTRTTNTPFYHQYVLPGTFIIKLITSSANGCTSDTVYKNLTVNPLPNVNLGNDTTICNNNTVLLDATTPNATYLWQNGAVTPTLLATTAGLYWAEVTNNPGCKKRDSINVFYKPVPVFYLGADTAICDKDTLTLNAASASATSYIWNTGAVTPAIKAYQAGLYWCQASSNGGCAFRDSIIITAVNPLPIVNLGNDSTLCGNNTLLLNATNPNSTYLWQNNAVTPTLLATTTGLYWAQVTNNFGCKKRDSVNLLFKPVPVFNLGIDTAICDKDTLTLNASGANAATYLWNTGSVNPIIKAWQAGLYWCQASNNGCIFRDSILITAVNPLPVVNLGNDSTLCGNNTLLLNATNPNSTYLWQNAAVTPTLLATTTGLFWAEVTNNFGCKKRDSVNLFFKPSPVFNLGADTAICDLDTLTLNASAANATTYLWSNGAATPSIKAYQAILYWCEAQKGGCSFRDSITITSIKPLPVVNLGNDLTLCEGTTKDLDATYLNSTYLWQDGSTIPVFRVIQPGTYRVIVNYNGCKKSDAIVIDYSLKPRFTLGPDQTICQGNAITLTPVLDPAWILAWQDGTTNPVYKITQPGLYTLSATNNCGSTPDDVLITKGLCKVYAPNAFTPNGDGKNDFFRALGIEAVTTFNLKIFNRYGQIIFETADKFQGWDGKFRGAASPAGSFVYIINYADSYSAEMQTIKGSFILIR